MGKHKRPPGEERRRPLAEINLLGDSRPRPLKARGRGCLGLFGLLVLGLGGAAALAGALLAG